MLNLDKMNLDDFYFNGHWLSEFGGIIGGQSGISSLSVSPELEIQSEKVLGRDGEIVYNSRFSPRVFNVPLYFTDITKIRDISAWLSVRTPQDFYFKDDTVKIKVMRDGLLDITPYTLQGTTEIKFIAHNPFYTAVDDAKYVVTKYDRNYTTIDPLTTFNAVSVVQYDRYTQATFELVNSDEQQIITDDTMLVYVDGAVTKNGNDLSIEVPNMDSIEIFNDGNIESYPLIKIVGTGNITVSIAENSFTVNNVSEYVYVDMLYCTVYKDFITNKIMDFDGSFTTLPYGYSIVSVAGNCTSIEIQCRSQWI